MIIAFIAIVGGATAFFGMDSYRAYLFHSDKDVLISAIQHARAQSIGNICLGVNCADGKSHGVSMQNDKFIIFQGTCYATPGCVRDPDDVEVDSEIIANPNLQHGGTALSLEVVFSQLAATTTAGTLTLTDLSNGRTTTITIHSEGQISWQDAIY